MREVTYKDRIGNGNQLSDYDLCVLASRVPGLGGMEWRHIHCVATCIGESNGYEWARPMVWDPGEPHHLSVDRGIAQFNTHWFSHVSDEEAFTPQLAMDKMQWWANAHKDSKPWDWTPGLDAWWHAYGTEKYKREYLPRARKAMNVLRNESGFTDA